MQITRPLNIPTIAPTRIAAKNPTASGSPKLTTQPAATQPDRAMTEPTESSMPPRMMTIVIPVARNRFDAF